ncbi:conserved hypothetical protein [Ricinus communis]|uniref:Uncharacterized protein n=1 Tax=Ricinus communis TaxID=3988 RepID=B9TD31_RICCO|nr:conserved hypothetical protein [Ricinus communis]
MKSEVLRTNVVTTSFPRSAVRHSKARKACLALAACHETFHLGLASIKGRLDVALNRVAAIYRLSESELKAYYETVKNDWLRRNQFSWVLDVSLVNGQPLEVKEQWNPQDDGSLTTENSYGDSHTHILNAHWTVKGSRTGSLLSLSDFMLRSGKR